MFSLNQFILVRLERDPLNPTKLVKLPLTPQKLVGNAHDPKNWLSYQKARELAGNQYAIGFVLTDNDPYFCIDIDHCLLPTGKWSPIAIDICTMMNGGYLESSVSGDGLHIWGRANNIPPHMNKNVQLNVEFYRKERFIVMGNHMQGDAEQDFSVPLGEFIKKYVPPKKGGAGGDAPAEWTSAPVDLWSGPTDDDELIALAMSKESIASVFGGSVSFTKLWEADETALSAQWPSATNGYDASSADMALAQRLAYWTGKDCERVMRIMRKSKLVRDKWDMRPDYLPRTVLSACTRQEKVWSDGKNKQNTELSGTSRKLAGGFVNVHELAEVFAGCIYIMDSHEVLTPEGWKLSPQQFKVIYGGYIFSIDDQKTTRDAWQAFTECPSWRPPTAESTCFLPEKEPLSLIKMHGRLLANTWSPPKIATRAGDPAPFLELLAKAYPAAEDQKILLSYMAALLQYPGHKFTWAPVLQGPKGSGKTFLTRCITEAIGRKYTHSPRASELGSKNNGWVDGKVFAAVQELMVTNEEDLNAIKSLVTDRDLAIEDKYVRQRAGDNRVNFMFTTNYLDAIRIDVNERRFCTFAQAQRNAKDLIRDGLDSAFWSKIHDWAEREHGFEIIADYLLKYKIEVGYNPAGGCSRAPRTSTWQMFIEGSASGVQQELMELMAQGRPGFAGGWISSMALDTFLQSRRLNNHYTINRRRQMLEDMGFVPHPHLPNGRCTSDVMPDGGRPRLFVRDGSIQFNMTDAKEIRTAYTNAQLMDAGAAVPMVPQTG